MKNNFQLHYDSYFQLSVLYLQKTFFLLSGVDNNNNIIIIGRYLYSVILTILYTLLVVNMKLK